MLSIKSLKWPCSKPFESYITTPISGAIYRLNGVSYVESLCLREVLGNGYTGSSFSELLSKDGVDQRALSSAGYTSQQNVGFPQVLRDIPERLVKLLEQSPGVVHKECL